MDQDNNRVNPFVIGVPADEYQAMVQQCQALAAPPPPMGPVFTVNSNRGYSKQDTQSVCKVVKGSDSMILVEATRTHKEGEEAVLSCQYPGYGTVTYADKSHDKTHNEEICSGTIDVCGKTRLHNKNGTVTELILLELVPISGIPKKISVPVEVFNNQSLLIKQFEENGFNFHKPNILSWLHDHLKICAEKYGFNEVFQGFYLAGARYCHSNEAEIYKNACEASGCQSLFGLCDNSINLQSGAIILLFAYSAILPILKSIHHQPTPIFTIYCKNIDRTKEELKTAFPDVPQIALGKHVEEYLGEVEGNVAFVIADEASDYYMGKFIEMINKSGSKGAASIDCVPIVLTSSGKQINDETGRIINLKLEGSIAVSTNKVVCRLMKWIISDNGTDVVKHMSSKYASFLSRLDDDPRLNEISSCFFASLLTIFDVYVSAWALDESVHEKLISDMTEYLINTNEGNTDKSFDMIKAILLGDMGIPVYIRTECPKLPSGGVMLVDDEKLCFDNPGFSHLSKLCGFEKSRDFADILRKSDLLLTDSKLQKKVSIPKSGKSENMYCIAAQQLFAFGEQMPQADEYACNVPEIQLCLGKTTADTPIYFTINNADGSQNSNVYISGTSGCGKSTLLRQWARESAAKGLETVVIDTDGQFRRMMNDNMAIVYSIGKEYMFSSSASGTTLSVAASACADLSAKQANELKELSGMLGKYDSMDELFDCFKGLMFDNDRSSLSDVIEIMTDSGVCKGKTLNWNDICCQEVISILDFSEINTMDIKPILDNVLQEIFTHKKSRLDSGVTVCTLILDEVQQFRLGGTAPLASQILRQGRKFGLSTVMATQYLTSDDANNISKLLNQCDSFCSFKPAKAIDTLKQMKLEKTEEAEYCLNNLETGQLIAKGNFSTDRCGIRYPVKIFVNNDR